MKENGLIEYQKSIAKYALRKMSAIDPQICVLGGAARNWIYGKSAKDIDIYYRTLARTEQEYINQITNIFTDSSLKSARISKSYGLVGIKKVINSVFVLGDVEHKVQFIALKDQEQIPLCFMESFDFDVCKCGMYKNGDIFKSVDFVADENNNTLTWNVSRLQQEQLTNAPARFEKMTSLFPERKVVVI